jgi:hypothetical protein
MKYLILAALVLGLTQIPMDGWSLGTLPKPVYDGANLLARELVEGLGSGFAPGAREAAVQAEEPEDRLMPEDPGFELDALRRDARVCAVRIGGPLELAKLTDVRLLPLLESSGRTYHIATVHGPGTGVLEEHIRRAHAAAPGLDATAF